MDSDMLRLWQLVHELSEQLAANQKLTATLQSQASTLKVQASDAGSGFALRRFNTDISNETFESELERMSAQTVIENQTLLHENKQLSLLLKEYEGTMDNIMSKFRNHALAAQRHELTLTRHYETLLHTRESYSHSSDLLSSTEMSHFLHRLSHHLRGLLRSLAGEPPDPKDPLYNDEHEHEHEIEHEHERNAYPDSPGEEVPVPLEELEALLEALNISLEGEDGHKTERNDWALERESEITRLEAENHLLRKMLGIDPDSMSSKGIVLDPIRDDPARFAKVVPKRIQEGGDPRMRPKYCWGEMAYDQSLIAPAPPPIHPLFEQHQAPLMLQAQPHGQGGAQQIYPGQRMLELQALDLQPGMRMGSGGAARGRRPGIIGRGRGRGVGGGVPMMHNVNNPHLQDQAGWHTQTSSAAQAQHDAWAAAGAAMGLTMQ
ncbi:hypothetical protein H0H87_012961 [Tephrocybe sp. NHM501043]|nr:hypothetical protein H0H87_012961 [Tephrocybe sp. NHM501043]